MLRSASAPCAFIVRHAERSEERLIESLPTAQLRSGASSGHPYRDAMARQRSVAMPLKTPRDDRIAFLRQEAARKSLAKAHAPLTFGMPNLRGARRRLTTLQFSPGHGATASGRSGDGSQRVPSSLRAQCAAASDLLIAAMSGVTCSPVASCTASSAFALLTWPR